VLETAVMRVLLSRLDHGEMVFIPTMPVAGMGVPVEGDPLQSAHPMDNSCLQIPWPLLPRLRLLEPVMLVTAMQEVALDSSVAEAVEAT
jgi:hypothetical protein